MIDTLMPTWLDFAYLLFVTVVLMAIETKVFFPRFKADALAGVPGTRRAGYRRVIVGQWVCAAMAMALWVRADRPWRDLGLVAPTGPRAIGSVLVVVIVGAFVFYQVRGVARITTDELAQLRRALREVEFLLPHTRDEARWFALVSVTAGVCEELVYRGFLVWALRPYVGTVAAFAIGVTVFALGHAYQGWRGVLKTGAAGIIMSTIVWGTGWLIPAMVVHALIDLNSGMLGFAAHERSPVDYQMSPTVNPSGNGSSGSTT
jgi:membrane protease YdiL (CAAX protease family)